MESFENAVDRILPGLEFEGVSSADGEYEINFKSRGGQAVDYD
jgi:hypothetical protein